MSAWRNKNLARYVSTSNNGKAHAHDLTFHTDRGLCIHPALLLMLLLLENGVTAVAAPRL